MRVLIAGNRGQLGSNLQKLFAAQYDVIGYDLPELDIANRDSIEQVVRENLPDIVINAAAYTNVDGCVENFELAYRVNSLGAQNIAIVCAAFDIDLVHVSSNEVFPGTKTGGYSEWDTAQAVNPYGETKAAAEFLVRHVHKKHYIVRLSWLFAPGGKNFVHTMYKFAKAGRHLRVVTDEIANPTYVVDLAEAIKLLVATGQYGTYHLSNEGSCSRYDFAREVLDLAGMEDVDIEPILSSEFKRKSTPPLYCGLKNTAAAALGIELRGWREAVAAYVQEHLIEETAVAVN